MTTFLVTVPAVSGEIYPLLSVVEGLTKRGHRVLVHTQPKADSKIKAAGAELVTMPNESFNLVQRIKDSQVDLPSWLPRFVRVMLRFRHEVLALAPDMVAELEPIIKREKIDCLIADNITLGAAYAAERCNIPFVTVTTSWVVTIKANGLPVLFPTLPIPAFLIHRVIDLILPLGIVRKNLGLPARPKNAPSEFFSVVTSQMLNLVVIYRDFITSKELSKNQIFIGPAAFKMPLTKNKIPLGESLQPGTLLVGTTTSSGIDDGFLRLVLQSVVEMEIPILATSGSATDIPREFGSKIRLETFIPHEEVLPYVRAFITHGGFGSVGRALRNGVPMLIISGLAESAATGPQVEKLGLAYHLPKHKATPKTIQAKLKALLEDYELHARVKGISKKLRSMDSPELAAKAIENILQIE
jgi:MGT family glycosyltransferase